MQKFKLQRICISYDSTYSKLDLANFPVVYIICSKLAHVSSFPPIPLFLCSLQLLQTFLLCLGDSFPALGVGNQYAKRLSSPQLWLFMLYPEH